MFFICRGPMEGFKSEFISKTILKLVFLLSNVALIPAHSLLAPLDPLSPSTPQTASQLQNQTGLGSNVGLTMPHCAATWSDRPRRGSGLSHELFVSSCSSSFGSTLLMLISLRER